MIHAILILAHSDLSYVQRLVYSFDSDFYLFIHWDRKSCLSVQEEDSFRRRANVKFFKSIYPINWGGLNMVKAILTLCGQALKYPEVEYLHLISGADVLVKNRNSFKEFFFAHRGVNFMEYFKLPSENWQDGGLTRMQYRHLTNEMDIKTGEGYHCYQEDLNRQKALRTKRELPNIPLYGGSTWWSLTRQSIEYVVSNTDVALKWFDQTFAPDEMFVQTLLMNDPGSEKIVNDNLRYICWEERNGNLPAVLDSTDFVKIIFSPALFARKIDIATCSATLVDSLESIRENALYVDRKQVCSIREVLDVIACYLACNYAKNTLGGLLHDNMGVLSFLLYYQSYMNVPIIYEEEVQVLKYSLSNNFINACGYPHNSEFMEMAIGWEFIIGKCNLLPEALAECLENANRYVYTLILDHKVGGKTIQHNRLDAYFRCRKNNGRLTQSDERMWLHMTAAKEEREEAESLIPVFNLDDTIDKINSIHSMGFIGYAGLGLRLLSEVNFLKLNDWRFIVY